ncbi:MAG: glyoxalase superfamily protein [Sedimenticolaceae bacterium]
MDCYVWIVRSPLEAIPVFRIFDVDGAKGLYPGFLGMQLDWKHQFEAESPD